MIKIRVPATSANIGPGFDSVGIAVDLFNEITVTTNPQFKIITDKELPSNTNNLVYKSIIEAFKYAEKKLGNGIKPRLLNNYIKNKKKPLPILITQKNNIPKTSGLGSSAACIVGGVLAGNHLLGDILSTQEVANICCEMEGHPDNVLPCLFGGAVAGTIDDGNVIYVKKEINYDLKLNICSPDFQLETRKSRGVLPKNYEIGDVVYSLSRAILVFSALERGDKNMLKKVVKDKLHEPYRREIIQGFDDVEKSATDAGALVTYLSGAGPSIASFIDEDFNSTKMTNLVEKIENKWNVYNLAICNNGAEIEVE